MNEMSHGFLINAKFENAKYFCTPYIVLGLLERNLRRNVLWILYVSATEVMP